MKLGWVMRFVANSLRVGFFVIQAVILTKSEEGITRQLSAEALCDLTFRHEDDINQASLQAIENVTFVVWAVCVPLFVIPRFHSLWAITDIAQFKDQLKSANNFYSLSNKQKVMFVGFVSTLLLSHYTMSAVTKYLGDYYQSRSVLVLSHETSEILAGLTTLILAIVSFGFNAPDCLTSTYKLVTQSYHYSWLSASMLVCLGVGVSGASVDFLMRFLETKNQDILELIPVLITVALIEFLYPILTSGSTLSVIPQLKKSVRQHPGYAGLFAVSWFFWWVMNTYQLGSCILRLINGKQRAVPASSEIGDICQAVIANRSEPTGVYLLVFVIAAAITFVSTSIFELYQYAKAFNIKSESAGCELTLFGGYPNGVIHDSHDNGVSPPYVQA